MVSETSADRKISWNAESIPVKPVTLLVKLEPQTLLFGSDLRTIIPDPLDSLLNNMPQVIQCAELLKTNKQEQAHILSSFSFAGKTDFIKRKS